MSARVFAVHIVPAVRDRYIMLSLVCNSVFNRLWLSLCVIVTMRQIVLGRNKSSDAVTFEI
jgi:hypothetical protein